MSVRVVRVWRRWWGLGRAVAAACVAMVVAGPASGASAELDAGFGGGEHGRVVITTEVYGVAVQANGRIIAVGNRDGENAVAVRLRPDGTRDTGFGTRRLSGPFGGRANGLAVAVQADGKILVAGSVDDAAGLFDLGVWRLRSSGALDTSFGTDGFAGFGDPAFSEHATSVAVDAQGRVVVAGRTSNGNDMIVVRFTTAGAPDASFNNVAGNGVPYFQITSAGPLAQARGIAVQGDGKIVVTGQDDGAAGLPVYRVIPGAAGAPAALDPGFGSGGLALVTGLENYGRGVSLQSDGAILAIGATSGFARPTVVRLTPDGVVDPSYGSPTGVHIRVPDATFGNLTTMTRQPHGGIAVAGTVRISDRDRAFVARLNARGAVDQGMGPGGARLLNVRDGDVNAMAVQADGRILAAGVTLTSTGRAGVVYRLLGGLQRPSCHGRKATIVGTRYADHIRGTGRADVIAGLGGNDTVKGLGRGDIICGGDGRDRLHGGPGDDVLVGGTGRDRLEGGPGHDRLRQ